MLFLSIILFAWYTISFVNGGMFKNILVKGGESKIKYAKGEISEESFRAEVISFGFIMLLFSLIMLGLELPVVIMGMASINNLIKFSSVGFLVYTILVIVWSVAKSKKFKEPDLSDETEISKYRNKLYKGRTLFSSLSTLLHVTYFGFIVYELLFV
jgi:cytosine/uracil/thiamine/allantoin permease